MKYLVPLITFLIISCPAHAHDFWLNPSNFSMKSTGKNSLSIRIGHADDKIDWPANPDRVISLHHFGPEGLKDLQSRINADGHPVPIQLETPGLHMIAITTTHAVSELPAGDFNDYVKEEGLTPIESLRKRDDLMDTPGREIYSRRGKALIRVGDDPIEHSGAIFKPIGLTLEVVSNPYMSNEQDEIGAQIFYRGVPLGGAQVSLVSLDTRAGDVSTEISDKNGYVTFPKPSAGDWMIHTVWSDPIDNHPLGDFDTTFSSLSFGY